MQTMILSEKEQKIKRVLGQSNYILLLILIVSILASCGEQKRVAEFEKYDSIFVDCFSNDDDIDYIHVSSLVAYYYKDHYYYTVTYTQEGDNFIYELLYILRYENMDTFFSIKDKAECYTYFPTEYENYLKAKKEGTAKTYSSKEIADMINAFYGSTIVDDSY